MYYPIVGAIELISAGYEGSVSDTTNNNSDTSSHLKAVGYLALVLDTLAAVSHNTSHVHRSVFLSRHLGYRQSTTLCKRSSFF